MVTNLSSSQRRQLLKMMFSGEEPKQSTYDNRKNRRTQLVKQGLITLEKRGRASHMVLTDKAWSEAPNLMAAELSAPGVKQDLAYHLMSCTHAYLAAEGLALADFVRPGMLQESAPGPSVADAKKVVTTAYLKLTGGQFDERVRVADLRVEAQGLSPSELDRTLMQLLRQGVAHLMPLDDPHDRTSRDDAAAVNVAGRPRHLVYLEQR